MYFYKKVTLFCCLFLFSNALFAGSLSLKSADIEHGGLLSNQQVFQGFGCNGGNMSPQFSWSGAPKGTKAFALFAYDPDAPTGSGWWHWQIVNIPKTANKLSRNAGNIKQQLAPKGSQQATNDYGYKGFGGACPPKGDGIHRYQFTLYALSKKLELPKNASAALVGYMVKASALESATIEAIYKRD